MVWKQAKEMRRKFATYYLAFPMSKRNGDNPVRADTLAEFFYGLVYALADNPSVATDKKGDGLVGPGIGHEIKMAIHGFQLSKVHHLRETFVR